jgi:predicted amidophosphoribosyltransferase
MFDTQRTPMGEALYQLKYSSDHNRLPEIIEAACQFLKQWSPPVGIVMPAPPSRQRPRDQPVGAIAKALGERLSLEYRIVRMIKNTAELKNHHDYDERIRHLENAFAVKTGSLRGESVLLVDDLYRSGVTLNAITTLLYDQGEAESAYTLVLTRTRRT